MARRSILRELWDFIRTEKKYWLAPILLVFVLMALLVAFANTSAVAPFIYTLF